MRLTLCNDKIKFFENEMSIIVTQNQAEQHLTEKVAEAVAERDEVWNTKMAAQEEANNEMLQAKVCGICCLMLSQGI